MFKGEQIVLAVALLIISGKKRVYNKPESAYHRGCGDDSDSGKQIMMVMQVINQPAGEPLIFSLVGSISSF